MSVKNIFSLAAFSALLVFTSCKKDYVNPGAAPSEQVATSAKALTGVAVGLQKVYTAGRAGSLYNRITTDGFITNQLVILNQGNTAEYQLYQGGNFIDGTNTVNANLWTSSNKILHDAELVITSAEGFADKNYASGLIGYATIFKALAIGDLVAYWERVPATTGAAVTFVTRAEGLKRAIDALDKAAALIAASPVPSSFTTNIPSGIDIANTLTALRARFNLYAGNYAAANTAAAAVDLSKASAFTFNAVNLNPIFETATSTNNVYQPIDSTMGLPPGLQPDLADKRIPFYIATSTAAPRYRIAGFGVGSLTPMPIYLPGEMMLIRAEASARQNDLVNGLAELNKVVTKKPAADPFGVGADLPPVVAATQAQLLDQIYRHRTIEMYLSGTKLEDMRRFARPTAERKRNYFPYPFQERDNNSNTPADPAF
jgi:hypothetical protein